MPILTAIILSAFVGYGAAWYFGAIEGNFSLLLFTLTLITFGYWLAERRRWEYGIELTPEDFAMLLDYAGRGASTLASPINQEDPHV